MHTVKAVWSNKRYVRGFAETAYLLTWLGLCFATQEKGRLWFAGVCLVAIVIVAHAIRSIAYATGLAGSRMEPRRTDFARGCVAAYAVAVVLSLIATKYEIVALRIGSFIGLVGVSVSLYYFVRPEEDAASPASPPPTGT